MSRYTYVGGSPLNYIDPERLLFGATFNGLRKDMSLDQAAQIGSMGNAAMTLAGVTAPINAATAAGLYVYFGVLSATTRAAISLLKGVADDAIPAPTPPQTPVPNPPAIVRPGGFSPPSPPPGVCPKP